MIANFLLLNRVLFVRFHIFRKNQVQNNCTEKYNCYTVFCEYSADNAWEYLEKLWELSESQTNTQDKAAIVMFL